MGQKRLGSKSPREVIRALEGFGAVVLPRRGKGSHIALRMPGVARPVIVQDSEHRVSMLKTIARQAELDWDEFCKAFR